MPNIPESKTTENILLKAINDNREFTSRKFDELTSRIEPKVDKLQTEVHDISMKMVALEVEKKSNGERLPVLEQRLHTLEANSKVDDHDLKKEIKQEFEKDLEKQEKKIEDLVKTQNSMQLSMAKYIGIASVVMGILVFLGQTVLKKFI